MVPATQDSLIIDTAELHNSSFSGTACAYTGYWAYGVAVTPCCMQAKLSVLYLQCLPLHISCSIVKGISCCTPITGFFFGMRRNIVRAAFNAKRYRLWSPHNRILGQEPDLWKRMVRVRRLSSGNIPPLISNSTTCVS